MPVKGEFRAIISMKINHIYFCKKYRKNNTLRIKEVLNFKPKVSRKFFSIRVDLRNTEGVLASDWPISTSLGNAVS